MSYDRHFALADDMIRHLNSVMGGVTDPFIKSRYVGFVSVAAVTVYELAIKEIFCNFGGQKHKVLGVFTRSYFDRINGRIKTKIIRDDYISRFGDKYVNRFRKKLEESEKEGIRNYGRSIVSSYNNIIVWRNEFAHAGIVPSTVTYEEVTQAYETGKEVIKCLSDTMKR